MSRRHNIQNSGDLPPFSENLVFYAPLSQGDLTDHVSGSTLVDPNGGVSWNEEKGMYLFTKQPKGYEMQFNVNLSISSLPYTIMADCQPVSVHKHNYPPFVVLGSYKNTDAYQPSLASLGGSPSREPPETRTDRKKRCACIYDISGTLYFDYYYIEDGVTSYFYRETFETSTHIANPINWSESNRTIVSLNPKRANVDVYNVYIKDVRIYNRGFTIDEVKQL